MIKPCVKYIKSQDEGFITETEVHGGFLERNIPVESRRMTRSRPGDVKDTGRCRQRRRRAILGTWDSGTTGSSVLLKRHM